MGYIDEVRHNDDTYRDVIEMGLTSAVLKRIDLDDQPIEDALRKLFSHVRLPNNGRNAGILLRQFSEVYHGGNPHEVRSRDRTSHLQRVKN